MAQIEPLEENATMINHLNALIREFNNMINIRTGRRIAAQSE